ncbi:hypothetical protein BJ170DRAFT_412278 [Xylariales sp. AK1849]|nr:hypothetical protein BJ170DRAFT_412278 [Xylariales sp. AK1849]
MQTILAKERDIPSDQISELPGANGPNGSPLRAHDGLNGGGQGQEGGRAQGQGQRQGHTNGGNASKSRLGGPGQQGNGGPRHEPVRSGHEEYPPNPPSSPGQYEAYRNEFFEVKKSPLAGLGAFALQGLNWGQTILVEKALFTANDVTLYDEIDKLTSSLKQAFERMHAYSTSPGFGRHAAIFRTNRYASILTLSASEYSSDAGFARNWVQTSCTFDRCD